MEKDALEKARQAIENERPVGLMFWEGAAGGVAFIP